MYKARKSVFCVHKKKEKCSKMKGKKQKKREEKRIKSKLQRMGNKRNHTYSPCCNNSGFNHSGNSEYKCSGWTKWINRKGKAGKGIT